MDRHKVKMTITGQLPKLDYKYCCPQNKREGKIRSTLNKTRLEIGSAKRLMIALGFLVKVVLVPFQEWENY